jgi:DNA-binding CsgD family transcriptional regulator
MELSPMNTLFHAFTDARTQRRLVELLQAETIDTFARGCQGLLGTLLPHHSVRVSFNDLAVFKPSLIRDTLPLKCNLSYLFERNLHDPTPGFLREHAGIHVSTYRAQVAAACTAREGEFFRRFMRPEGWDKDAEIYFWNSSRLEAYLCVRRAPGQPEFADDELKLLEDLREALGGCVHRLRAQHRERLALHCYETILAQAPIPVLVLDWNLDPVFLNNAARAASAEWLLGAEAARALKLGQFGDIPPEVVAGCEKERTRLEAAGFRRDARRERFEPRFASVFHPKRDDFFAQIETVDGDRETIGLPSFVIRFQRATLARTEREAFFSVDTELTALSCLSPCEREIVMLVREGLSNQDIADRLSKSVPTVKMQLQSVFRKLNVTNRTQIAALLA